MPLVHPTSTPLFNVNATLRLLVCESTGRGYSILNELRSRGYCAEAIMVPLPISCHLHSLISNVEMVLLDVTARNHDVVNAIEELNAAIGICCIRPRLLCFSMEHRNPQLVLNIQKRGARYVRVGSPEMLVEAIELLLAETRELENNGPCFRILHRFSQGSCAPGEEISAVLLENAGDHFHLPVGLAERFVFDLLAQRRIAVDSLQIVSGLAGDWFYRDHGSNSGHRQVKKVRRPTVKVLIQRIREAMATTFTEARLRLDPYDVLRSCPAEGTNRVLYKLHAQVRWQHISR